MSDDPSPPVTLSATITALGMVRVCATAAQVMSKTILPSDPDAGKFVNVKVTDALVVIVW